MTNIIEQIKEMRPVFRVSDRDATVDFYTTVLGLKLLKENSFMLEFGTHKIEQTRIICAISPESLDFHKAEGQKRHLVTLLKIPQAELRQLIARYKDKIEKIYCSEAGYAFNTVSPDGDSFTVMTDESGPAIEIPKADLAISEDYYAGVTDMTVVSTMIASPDAGDFYDRTLLVKYIHAVPIPGDSVSETDTWDLGAVQFKLKEGIELGELTLDLTNLNYSLNDTTQVFTVTAPNNLEIQFIK